MKMLNNYDSQGDVLYLGIKKGEEEEFIEVSPGVNVELNSQREIIGVEILNASKILRPIIKDTQKRPSETLVLSRR